LDAISRLLRAKPVTRAALVGALDRRCRPLGRARQSLRRLGFSADDIAWLLDHVDGEIVVMRPAGPEHLTPRASRARAIAVSPRLNRA
jgi:hypothetical protein